VCGKEGIEYYSSESFYCANKAADYWRDIIGFNVIPSNGKALLKGIEYSLFFDKPIPQVLHDYWG
jgi:hypothetical protein